MHEFIHFIYEPTIYGETNVVKMAVATPLNLVVAIYSNIKIMHYLQVGKLIKNL